MRRRDVLGNPLALARGGCQILQSSGGEWTAAFKAGARSVRAAWKPGTDDIRLPATFGDVPLDPVPVPDNGAISSEASVIGKRLLDLLD